MAKTVITVSLDDDIISFLRDASEQVQSSHPAINFSRSALINHFIRTGMHTSMQDLYPMVEMFGNLEQQNNHRYACSE